MQPQTFYRAVAEDFSAVDEIIKKQLTSRVPLVSKIGDYITSAGGKRLRPLLVLLCGKALGREGADLRLLAATIEFLHTATLLHDDVVDMSGMRRGRSTANALWGNAPSVLVGDFLYSRSFEMMVELGSMPVMQILSKATRVIAEGEVLQLSRVRDASTTEEVYMDVIRGKTAMLFEASTHSAAALAEASEAQREALRTFGDHLGVAFQLVDDLLDYEGDAEALGKNVGDDLAEGKPTLPLIYTMREGTPEQAALVRKAIQKGGLEDLEQIREAVNASGALKYTAELARAYVKRAIECLEVLPASEYRDALVELSEFAVARTH
ncbi:polyprenyl synthetase family protein [Pseudomonas vlassakiae]|uniref:polyprenyl synthetase family protein n=1 Tax=Pseudomonas TaxID=286 RepID=UPI000EC2F2FC|nr:MULTISPECIES: polyprenyl synthetase family protein [Pseudomonas]MCU0126897.1 polyprenyl synthetase family protein [Pseudomonas vlassakiae]HCV38722.1 octaprenyl-diphosphate synthase [Pseudomonas sp.]